MDLLALTRTNPNRIAVAHRLFRFYVACAASGLPELERLATTVQTWWPEIEVAIRSGVANAASELRHHPTRPRTPHDTNQRTPFHPRQPKP